MKLVAVSRVRNEEDIVEAFIRHHAGWLDAHIFIDNGSTDGTLRILHALRAEGLPLVLFQNYSGASAEPVHGTLLYRMAGLELAADWVLFLDCDEFLTLRGGGGTLAARLADIPAEIRAIRLPMLNYLAPNPATASRLNVVERLVRRKLGYEKFGKVMLRGSTPGALVGHGSHTLMIDGRTEEGWPQEAVILCHYPERSVFQVMAKNVLGRLKVIAAGQSAVDANWGLHYAEPFAAITRDLPSWLANAEAVMGERMVAGGLVDDPMPYRGGALTHTAASSDMLRAMSSLIGGAEALARMLGRAHDLTPSVQTDMFQQAAKLTRVF